MKDKKILLVEDNENDELLALRAFKQNRLGNDVVVARDGVEALDYLFATGQFAGRDITSPPQLTLLDLGLPRLSGLDVLRAIRKDPRTKLLPVVVLTSSSQDEDIVRSYSLGANGYVRKPVEFNGLNEAVKALGLYWLIVNEAPPLPWKGT